MATDPTFMGPRHGLCGIGLLFNDFTDMRPYDQETTPSPMNDSNMQLWQRRPGVLSLVRFRFKFTSPVSARQNDDTGKDSPPLEANPQAHFYDALDPPS